VRAWPSTSFWGIQSTTCAAYELTAVPSPSLPGGPAYVLAHANMLPRARRTHGTP